jgi:hypothetical protein
VGPTDVQKSFAKVDQRLFMSIPFGFLYVLEQLVMVGLSHGQNLCHANWGRLARGTCIRPRKWRTEAAVRLEAEPAEMTMSAVSAAGIF